MARSPAAIVADLAPIEGQIAQQLSADHRQPAHDAQRSLELVQLYARAAALRAELADVLR